MVEDYARVAILSTSSSSLGRVLKLQHEQNSSGGWQNYIYSYNPPPEMQALKSDSLLKYTYLTYTSGDTEAHCFRPIKHFFE